jgi:hypothetical protein
MPLVGEYVEERGIRLTILAVVRKVLYATTLTGA